MNDNQEESDAARALLETKRHVMTGREIEQCEYRINGGLSRDQEAHSVLEEEISNAARCPHCDEILDENIDEAELDEIEARLSRDKGLFESLRIQFSREIGEWIANRDRDISRRAVETHNHLHPQAA